MILYVNACSRKVSRTNRLAKVLLSQLGEYTELKLDELGLLPLNGERLEARADLISKGDYKNELFALSNQFAGADTIVIAAPFWDNSFPTILKMYIENIYVTGIVTKYGMDGQPQGLCKAKKLFYVTTAGGPYNPRYSYEYIEDLAKNMFGIKDTELIYAENLDIYGNDAEQILNEVIKLLKGMQLR